MSEPQQGGTAVTEGGPQTADSASRQSSVQPGSEAATVNSGQKSYELPKTMSEPQGGTAVTEGGPQTADSASRQYSVQPRSEAATVNFGQVCCFELMRCFQTTNEPQQATSGNVNNSQHPPPYNISGQLPSQPGSGATNNVVDIGAGTDLYILAQTPFTTTAEQPTGRCNRRCWISLAALYVYAFSVMISAMRIMTLNSLTSNDIYTKTSDDYNPTRDIHEVFFSIFGIVSATLIVLFDYRKVALSGSITMALGYLFASFTDGSNISLLNFLYGFMTGIGRNMVEVACVVLILEYNREDQYGAAKGLRSITSFHVFLIQLFGLIFFRFLDWPVLVRIQTGFSVVMALFSLALIPENVMMDDQPWRTRVSGIVGIESLKIYKRIYLYTFALYCFFWFGGTTLLAESFGGIEIEIIGIFKVQHAATPIVNFFAMIGAGVICFKKISLRGVRDIIILSCLFMCIFILILTQSLGTIGPFVVAPFIGIFRGFASPMPVFIIPVVVGQGNIAVGTGAMTLAQGLGELIMKAAADGLIERDLPGSFILSGFLILMSSVFITVTYFLIGLHCEKIWKEQDKNDPYICRVDPYSEQEDQAQLPVEPSQ